MSTETVLNLLSILTVTVVFAAVAGAFLASLGASVALPALDADETLELDAYTASMLESDSALIVAFASSETSEARRFAARLATRSLASGQRVVSRHLEALL